MELLINDLNGAGKIPLNHCRHYLLCTSSAFEGVLLQEKDCMNHRMPHVMVRKLHKFNAFFIVYPALLPT